MAFPDPGQDFIAGLNAATNADVVRNQQLRYFVDNFQKTNAEAMESADKIYGHAQTKAAALRQSGDQDGAQKALDIGSAAVGQIAEMQVRHAQFLSARLNTSLIDPSLVAAGYQGILQEPTVGQTQAVAAEGERQKSQAQEAGKASVTGGPPNLEPVIATNKSNPNDRINATFNKATGQYQNADGTAPNFSQYIYAPPPAATIENATNPFMQGLGTQEANNLVDLQKQAQANRNVIQFVHQQKSLLDQGIISGSGANWQVELGKALQKAGFYTDKAPIAATQAYGALAAQDVMAAAKALGTNRVTNMDLQFAAKAAAGDVTFTEPALRQILDQREQLARMQLGDYNALAKKAQTALRQQNAASPIDLTVQDPGEYQPPVSKSKSGRPIVLINGQWMYQDGKP